MFNADQYPITVAEVRSAEVELDALIDEDERTQLTDWVAVNPEAGDIIPGTNGVRKLLWRYGRKGSRQSIRVIYYFRDLNMPVYLLAIYRRGEKLNMTTTEKRDISALVDLLVEECSIRNYGAAVVQLDRA